MLEGINLSRISLVECYVLFVLSIYGVVYSKYLYRLLCRLCGVAVNAYLTMLLDTGVLHCEFVFMSL